MTDSGAQRTGYGDRNQPLTISQACLFLEINLGNVRSSFYVIGIRLQFCELLKNIVIRENQSLCFIISECDFLEMRKLT